MYKYNDIYLYLVFGGESCVGCYFNENNIGCSNVLVTDNSTAWSECWSNNKHHIFKLDVKKTRKRKLDKLEI